MITLTLHQEVDNDCVEAPGIGGHAGVVPRILCLDRTEKQGAVVVDHSVAIDLHWDSRVLTATDTKL